MRIARFPNPGTQRLLPLSDYSLFTTYISFALFRPITARLCAYTHHEVHPYQDSRLTLFWQNSTGANGMGISAGKSMVYAACGLQPHWLLPIQVDNGTENEVLLNDPLYVGDRRRRERGAKYDQLLEELVEALRTRYGRNTIIHWEDFAPRNAFRVLQKFRSAPISAVTYNDDIQGTAAVTVAGTLASVRLLKVRGFPTHHTQAPWSARLP